MLYSCAPPPACAKVWAPFTALALQELPTHSEKLVKLSKACNGLKKSTTFPPFDLLKSDIHCWYIL